MSPGSAPDEWVAWFAHVPSPSGHLVWMLDAVERERRHRFARDADRDRFTAGAALARLLVSDLTGVDADAVRLDRTCDECGRPHGRPRVVDAPGLGLSVSHSGGLAIAAAAPAAAVGVDVEAVRADWRDLAATACTPGESAGIDGPFTFARTWVRKEAVLKAHGAGLRIDPREVEVSPATRAAALVRLGDTRPPAVLVDLDVGPEHAAAAALLGVTGAPPIRLVEATARLTTGCGRPSSG